MKKYIKPLRKRLEQRKIAMVERKSKREKEREIKRKNDSQ